MLVGPLLYIGLFTLLWALKDSAKLLLRRGSGANFGLRE